LKIGPQYCNSPVTVLLMSGRCLRVGQAAERCVRESTEWSACSVTCGMGVSIRVTNDNEQCKSQQQQRLCLIRPCDLDDEQFVSFYRATLC